MTSTPAIRIARDRCYTGQPAGDSRSGTATPMAIPRAREPVPPPLPPPTILPEQDFGWQFGNSPNDTSFGRPASVKPGSSLLGDSLFRQGKEHDLSIPGSLDQQRRNSSVSTVTQGNDHDMTDERDVSVSIPISNTELKSEKGLSQKTLETSSQTYDRQLLDRIGGPNTTKRQSLPYSPSVLADVGQISNGVERRHSALQASLLKEKRQSSLDASSGVKWPGNWALSPRSNPLWKELGVAESVNGSRHGSLASDEASSHRGSYDHSMFVNDEFYMGEGQLSNLYIDDQSPGSPKAGSKRRASSPPREREDRSSISSASGQSEIFQRRSIHQLPNRTSPISRFQPDQASISSASSIGARHGSLGSSLGMASVPSSATSYASSRASPSLISPTNDADLKRNGASGLPNGTSPSNIVTQHQRTMSESAPSIARKLSSDSVAHSRKSSLSNLPGGFMCECCPKKPKRFETEEELRSHENEKQYTCSFCPHRFKNKNEAERHQNSLHLRRQSWSCSALTGVGAAFYNSSPANGSDVCAYCGQEFSNPPQWDRRAEHLNHVHKFGECNQAKKFFRADHFRQHLKHSHQGTSGKWTNHLETACMKDEPQEKSDSPGAVPVLNGGVPPALKISTTMSGPGPPAPATETIEETPHDS